MPRRGSMIAAGWFGLLALSIAAFHATGRLHGDFVLDYAGTKNLPRTELVFWAWFGLYGTLAAAFGTLAWRATALPAALLRCVEKLVEHRSRWLALAALLVLAAGLGIRHGVLLGEPVTDDELVYQFIGRTLLQGRVVNPPPIDPDFLRNQWVIATPDKWYGKYPIGHPALLAIGEALRAPSVVVPMLSALCLWLTALVGGRWFGSRVGLLGALLLLVSPQFLFTAATDLSQPSEMLFLLLALWATLRLTDDARHRWAALAGLATGAAILVRPFPGGLFALVLAAQWLWAGWPRAGEAAPSRLRLSHLLLAGVGPVLGVAAVLAVNFAQTGDPLHSGYQQVNLPMVEPLTAGEMGASFGGALMRQNFWLFGWPVSLLFVAWARPRSPVWLFWGVLAAEYSYRLLVPKTVVSTTGPVYVMEIVPLLALGTAAALSRLVELLRRLGVPAPREWIASGLLAGCVVMLTMFLPSHVEGMRGGALERGVVQRMLRQAAPGERVVVFATWLADPQARRTWAYAPPSPWPDLRDDVLFLRWPDGPDALQRIQQLLKRFPERRAFAFANQGGDPRLVPIPRE